MQQHAATCPPTSGTGPGAEAITPAQQAYANVMTDSRAVVTVEVTHNAVIVTAALDMGQRNAATQRWERRRGPGKGWHLIDGPRLWMSQEDRISTELAEFMDELAFPFELANMLPRRATSAAADAIAAAALEVANA